MATAPRTKCLNDHALYLSFVLGCPDATSARALSRAGSGTFTRLIMMKASTNTPMPMNSRGVTSFMEVLSSTVPTRTPTRKGVRVAVRELSEPPVCTSWLPLFPPPPSVLSIGFTTVLSMQTQNPLMKAPSRYMIRLSATTWPCTVNTGTSAPTRLLTYWTSSPTKPTPSAVRDVFLYPTVASILPAGMPMNR